MTKKSLRKPQTATLPPQGEATNWVGFFSNSRRNALILFLFSFLLYANTLGHDYSQDDAIVITDNMFTREGIKGIKGILSYDTFYGFFKEEGKANLVAGGRYRPLTLVLFAIEYQLFGQSPFAGHLFNLLWYGLTVVLLFYTLLLLLRPVLGRGLHITAFLAALLFAAHPVHTEAVANIKGRDEIICLLLSLGALYAALRWYDSRRWHWLGLSGLSLFLGLLAKENAVTYLAVIPAAIWFFRAGKIRSQAPVWLPLIAATGAFLLIRTAVLGQLMGGPPPMELMNNPFLKLTDGVYVPFSPAEKSATIVYALGKYLQLLLFPHPLTHDYYPREIGILSWSDIAVVASLLMYLALAVFAVLGLRKRSILSFGILYFLATLSIVSNIVFPVGTHLSERFLFMPSVGFCLIFAYWLVQAVLLRGMRPAFATISVAILLLWSGKTIARNPVWKDNATLFLTDVMVSDNSAKLQNAAGGEKIRLSTLTEDPARKQQLLAEAKEHLKKAIGIHPTYKNAFLLLGNAHFYSNEFPEAITAYTQALSLDPDYADAQKNLGVAYRDGGRFLGEKLGDLNAALQYLTQAYRYLPEDYETNRLLGVATGLSGNNREALNYFRKAAELMPELADAWYNLGTALQHAGDNDEAAKMYEKARAIDPEIMQRNRRE